MKKSLLALAMLSLFVAACVPKDKIKLKYTEQGSFKIAQLTDIHWGWNDTNAAQVLSLIATVAEQEMPQLFVLTGDIVTGADSLAQARESWRIICDALEKTAVPYAIVLGNHDAESCDGISASMIFEWLREFAPGCINVYGAADVFGQGNKALPIYSHDGSKVENVVYVIDSNDYPEPVYKRFSDYAWIHADQIQWYVDQSNKFKSSNGGKAVPSLAYFHICVPEYDKVAADPLCFGSYNERTCPSNFNSGFFTAAFNQHDMLGMFVGHDHTNDFCGIYCETALCYGRQSGVDGISDNSTPMGSRIVQLSEGKRCFDTWVRTHNAKSIAWNYPTGFSEEDDIDLWPCANVAVGANGVAYKYYEGVKGDKSTDVMLVPEKFVSEGTMSNFDISKAPVEDHFGYDFDAWFMAPEDGPYRFELSSDDGSKLYIDGRLVIDNDGSHSSAWKQRTVGLAGGMHRIRVKYYENYMGQSLNLYVMSREIERQSIPDNLLFLPVE